MAARILQIALTAIQENKRSEAVSTIAALKPQAAQLCSKLEVTQEKLSELEKSLNNRIHFLYHHTKLLEKRERAALISKSISESIQHTQCRKLHILKWELMKARNAFFSARKKLTRRERESRSCESRTSAPSQILSEEVSSIQDDLSATVQKIQIIVNTLSKECLQKENSITDTAHKIVELTRKFEVHVQETNHIRIVCASLKSRAKDIKTLKLCIAQDIILWTLCTKAFDNGHKKEDVLSSIAKQAHQTRQQDSPQFPIDWITTSQGLFQQLEFTPHCLLCCAPLPATDGQASFTCKHCLGRDTTTNNKVLMETFACTEQGNIVGSVNVRNIAYDKEVVVRYSQDSWRSSNDQNALYKHSDGNCDHFHFQLPFNISISLYLEFAVCYRVAGEEFWDNNEGRNYKVVF